MAILITTDYFINDINIPTGTYATPALQAEISKYEPEILQKALGYELYKLVAAAYEDIDAADQRIKDLVQGKVYTENYDGRDRPVKWNGLVNSDYISLIAYYIYYRHAKNNITQSTKTAEVEPQQENATRAVWANKAFSAYVRLRALYGYPGQDLLSPSLYNFLYKYESVFPEWVFSELGSVNMLDL
jgi:hypothetical protein